ncbi:unnamed protein product [Rhizophagus irregularis]|uniref:Uncharacterized protein n=1 Tax=Rhizophagus irregularis TaxID=588596 RepID=A0A915ZBF0_9GLOM|nr:unnamed protein product [Rhizophagus irregularis]
MFTKVYLEETFVKIVNKGGYWSYAGKQGGEQELSVTKGWPIQSVVLCTNYYTRVSEVKRDFEIGQLEMLSEGDIKAINMLYLDSTPDIQRVKITASNEEMKLQFLLKIKSKIFRRKRSQ